MLFPVKYPLHSISRYAGENEKEEAGPAVIQTLARYKGVKTATITLVNSSQLIDTMDSGAKVQLFDPPADRDHLLLFRYWIGYWNKPQKFNTQPQLSARNNVNSV